ncbi:MAG: hypothetical protein UR66_C0023G0003 [Candidatus Moranbacteria bacterium GW2011_GWE1_35_17]|nr:MAG: hypothetical protein UR66_C0023G0003 [Candidatus Moranbacteria bacterium GW2011_GWE1_35_17]
MKRIIFVTLFLSFFGFNYSALAYDACDFNNHFIPCTYQNQNFDSLVTGNFVLGYVPVSWSSVHYLYFNFSETTVSYYSQTIADNTFNYHSFSNSSNHLFIIGEYYPTGFWGSGNDFAQEGPGFALFGAIAPSMNLYITRSPELGGGVSDYPAGENIYCGIDSYEICEASFPLNTVVTLDASHNEGYEFSHWEINDLAMADIDGSIDVTMDEAKNVVAVFYLKADDFVFPVLAEGVTNPLQNKFNPVGDGWNGPGVGEYSAAAGHLGQDYVMNYNNGDGNAAGEPVYAVANGTIVEVMNNQNTSYGWCNNSDHGWGPVVVIRHENRDGFGTTGSIVTTSCDTETNPTVIYSLYGHLSKTSIQNLQIGQTVHMGDQLGVTGAYGVDQSSWTTNHLHFELKDEVGYAEGVWYKTPANEGVCPESTSYPCDSYLVKGVGTAYSMGSNFAPHRYEPGAFINLN